MRYYERSPNSLDLSPELDYHLWGAMLQAFYKFHRKIKSIPELARARCDTSLQTVTKKTMNEFCKL